MESKGKRVWKVIKPLAIILAAAIWIFSCYATYVSNKLEKEKNDLIKEQRDILLEQRDALLKLVPSRTPYPGNDTADPICGDPAALKPAPEVHKHGK